MPQLAKVIDPAPPPHTHTLIPVGREQTPDDAVYVAWQGVRLKQSIGIRTRRDVQGGKGLRRPLAERQSRYIILWREKRERKDRGSEIQKDTHGFC